MTNPGDLIAQIRNVGYPTELQAGSIMSNQGLGVTYNSYYVDKDERKGREIDICAFVECVTSFTDNSKISIGLHVICEVKYSQNTPWIIFSTKKEAEDSRGWNIPFYCSEIFWDISGDELESKSTISKFRMVGRSYSDGLNKNKNKSDSKKSPIFDSLTKVVKATEYCLEEESKAAQYSTPQNIKYLNFIEQIVVVDGLLYEVYLGRDNKLQVHDANHLLVAFRYVSPNYRRRCYLIELVTLKQLQKLMKSKIDWIQDVSNKIVGLN
jgi:hypothetical protein